MLEGQRLAQRGSTPRAKRVQEDSVIGVIDRGEEEGQEDVKIEEACGRVGVHLVAVRESGRT